LRLEEPPLVPRLTRPLDPRGGMSVDELRAAGNVPYRVTAMVPLPLMEEFVEPPLYGLLEVERL
jgi:hypothetical protein